MGHRQPRPNHGFHQFVRHVDGHVVVDASPRQNHLRVVAHALRLVGEVVGVHADAMPTHQAGPEFQEIPLGSGGVEHVHGVDAQPVEDQRQLVYERDVDIALSVFDGLGGFGHLDRGRWVRTRADDAAVQLIDEAGDGGRGAGRDLQNLGNAPFFIAGVDAFGRIAAEKVNVVAQAARGFQRRHAIFLRAARIHRGFVNYHVAGLQVRPNHSGGRQQRR